MQTTVPCRIASCCASIPLVLAAGLVLFLCPLAAANDDAPAESSTIDSREQELRRKEEELLRAIDFSSPHSADAAIEPAEGPLKASKVVDESPAVIVDLNAPQEPVAIEPLGNSQASDLRAESPTALKELTRHPALEPPKKMPMAPQVAPNRVRTKSYDDSPDGTTAKRVGSFYRIDRGGDNTNSNSGISRARTVPIQDMSPANTVRPALLTSDELATIRNSSTYLRTGPTRLDSALVKVPQYAEVTIDYRSGTWYRVRTENGIRGWVPGSSLLFDAHLSPHSTVRVSGVR